MADIEFNIAKGRIVELHNRVVNNDPTNSALIIVILKTAESDATLKDYATLSALLAGSNVEADFTNYARIVLDDGDLSAFTTDNTNDRNEVDFPDQTITDAGGATNNTTEKLLICYDSDTTGGTDANIVPLLAYDFVKTTDGSDLPIVVNSNGYYRAP